MIYKYLAFFKLFDNIFNYITIYMNVCAFHFYKFFLNLINNCYNF